MTSEQKRKLADLFAKEHVAVLITRGDPWPTGTMQAFAETDDLDLLFIMGATAEKYQNLLKDPHVTVVVDTRDSGNVPTFEVARASIQGVAAEVQRGEPQSEAFKAIFLKKNPFEEPFFANPALRMMRIAPKRVSYANGLKDSFKLEL
ncbi:MAG TPA: pyridoxamine 5'-phosphate oxidase family protein [Candidatus Binataceae bacterium]|nr:pyridoxamine 5'-phosphate oxidase family protein [Candidatus Binataceae bacterium]